MAESLAIAPPQAERNWCWAAVASTLGRYFFPGTPLTQCQIATRVIGNGVDCCNGHDTECNVTQELDDVLDNLNAMLPTPMKKTSLPRAMTFQEVRDAVDGGLPVCVRIEWLGGGGHFVMITGYSITTAGDGWVDVSDPFYPDSTVPFAFFSAHYMLIGHWTDTYVMEMQ